jgi:hypothetical protein
MASCWGLVLGPYARADARAAARDLRSSSCRPEGRFVTCTHYNLTLPLLPRFRNFTSYRVFSCLKALGLTRQHVVEGMPSQPDFVSVWVGKKSKSNTPDHKIIDDIVML